MRVGRIKPRRAMMLHGMTLNHLAVVHRRMKRGCLTDLAWLSIANGSTAILYLGIS